MGKITLTDLNIFEELQKGYDSIHLDLLNTPLVLKFNKYTFEIYKRSYASRFGWSLPVPINFMGLVIEVDDTMRDNCYTISTNNHE